MFSYNRGSGIGTRYYGATDHRPDGSFVTTKWLLVFWMPVWPLCSLRVKVTRAGNWWGRAAHYEDLCEAPLDKRFVRRTYAWLLIPTALLFITLCLAMGLPAENDIKDDLVLLFATLLMIGLGFWMAVFPSLYRPAHASSGRTK